MELNARLEDWLSLRPVIIHVYEAEVPSVGRDLRNHSLGNHYAWLLSAGEVTVVQSSHTTYARSGEWLIAHPGERWQKFSPDARILSIQFQAKWPDGRQLFDEGLSRAFPSAAFPDVEVEARRLLAEMKGCFPANPLAIPSTPLSLEKYLLMQHHGLGFLWALVKALLADGLLPSRMGQTDERLLIALRCLDRWPLEIPLDTDDLARQTGLTLDHLARCFQKAFEVTPSRYLANRREDYARRLLAHSGVPVKEIASNLGFSSLSDFSAWFKRIHHRAPRDYRKSAQSRAFL